MSWEEKEWEKTFGTVNQVYENTTKGGKDYLSLVFAEHGKVSFFSAPDVGAKEQPVAGDYIGFKLSIQGKYKNGEGWYHPKDKKGAPPQPAAVPRVKAASKVLQEGRPDYLEMGDAELYDQWLNEPMGVIQGHIDNIRLSNRLGLIMGAVLDELKKVNQNLEALSMNVNTQGFEIKCACDPNYLKSKPKGEVIIKKKGN